MLEIERLVVDTLYYRCPSSEGCFAVNSAGMALIAQNADALLSMERVLVQTVAPKFNSGRTNEFLGLDYLLGAYLAIGSKYEPTRVVSFLKILPIYLQAVAITVIPIFLDSARNKSVSGVLVADEILTYLNEASSSATDDLRTAAKRAISFL